MLLSRNLLRKTLSSINFVVFNRAICIPHLKYSTTKFQNVAEVDDKPIEYSKSAASQWQAKSSRMGTDKERLWYEPYVALVSVAVFMIYFCVLREENDVDKEFDNTLYKRIKGLEERQLILSLHHNHEQGLDTKAIEERLKQIAESKK